jgi:hypothetical protein
MRKMGKKLISLFLAVLMLLGCLTTMAVAGDTDSSDTTAQSPKLIVDFNMDTAKSDAVINAADNRAFTVQGGATLADGQSGHGKALQLDGSTNYINLGTDYQIKTGAVSIAAWVKVDSSPNGLSKITCRGRTGVPGEKDLSLYVRSNGALEAQASGWTASDTGAVTLGKWQHVAVVNDGKTMTLYVNGKAVKTKAGAEAPADNWTAAALLIGAGWNKTGDAPFAGHMFKGLLDDLKIYDGALTADEIADLAGVKIEKYVADFNFDSAQSNKVTNSIDNKAFTVEGGATLADGQSGHGKALQLDGSTNYINLGTDYQIKTGAVSIAAWVKVDSSPNGLSKITCRGRTGVPGEKDLSLYVRSNGALEAQASGWTASDTGAVTLGKWQHVAVVNDGKTMTLYVNGKAVKTKAGAEVPADNWTAAALLIGAGWNKTGDAPFAGHMFKGLLDDLKIYDGALTADEIAELAKAPTDDSSVTLPDAVYEFTMNEIKDGTGTLAGKKVILDTNGHEYPIYGTSSVDQFGIYDQSIVFDGSTTYVDIGKPSIEKQYTLEAWTYIDSATQTDSRLNKIFGRDKTTVGEDALYLCVRGNGTIEYSVSGNKGTSGGGWYHTDTGTYKFNSWNHVAVTYDGKTYKIYFNGKLVLAKDGGSVDESTNPMDLLIGAGYNADGTGIYSGHAYKGRMDDVRIYNVALSADQIQKSTEGIKDKVPPEVSAIDPDSSMISADAALTLSYNMTVARGTAEPTLTDKEGKSVELTLVMKDADDTIDGTDSLVIQPNAALTTGETYTLTLPAGVVVNGKGIASRAASYTFTIKQSLEGNSASSSLKYWVSNDNKLQTVIEKQGDKLVMTNGLVSRIFDLTQNFLTVSYKNLYTGLEALDQNHLQADVRLSLNDTYHDGDDTGDVKFLVGGVDKTTPTFQYTGYQIEDKTQEIYHWEWNESISPAYMKDTKWPAAGKALIVSYKAPDGCDAKFAGVTVQVRYEIYDGIPVIGKTVTVTNSGDSDVIVHHLTSEVLPMPTSLQDAIYMESNMDMEGGLNHDRNNARHFNTKWISSSDNTGVLLSRYTKSMDNDAPEYGPAYRLAKGASFEGYRLYDLFYSTSYYEWQMMEVKKMYRTLFPQTTDAPLIYHIISSNSSTVKKGIDEAKNSGFNMVLLSFGSGVNAENTSADNIKKYKELCDYAHSKGIMLGAYIMQVARGDSNSGDSNDIYSGGWGKMRCMTAQSAKTTQENTLSFIRQTGLNCLEIDGIYPGTVCPNTHAGHEGKEDSITKQWQYAVRDFMKELRALNVYINAPDWTYLCGGNMAVMGYQESGFNVSRARQLIYGREMAYYGTFEKMPAMGWTLVPLSAYQGWQHLLVLGRTTITSRNTTIWSAST